MVLTGHEQAGEALRYRTVLAAGTYDVEHQFLLDNQIRGGQAGYQVLTPLTIKNSGLAVLVNRGWVSHGLDRRAVPEVRLNGVEAEVRGTIDNFPRVGFKLEGAEIPAPGWPSLVQVLDAEQLSGRLGYRVLPYQVLLDPDQRDGYVREWHQASLQPEKNQGYALQWFSFAVVLMALYIWYGFKPRSRA